MFFLNLIKWNQNLIAEVSLEIQSLKQIESENKIKSDK